MYCLEVLEEMNQRMTEAVTIGSLLEELRQTPREDTATRRFLLDAIKHRLQLKLASIRGEVEPEPVEVL